MFVIAAAPSTLGEGGGGPRGDADSRGHVPVEPLQGARHNALQSMAALETAQKQRRAQVRVMRGHVCRVNLGNPKSA